MDVCGVKILKYLVLLWFWSDRFNKCMRIKSCFTIFLLSTATILFAQTSDPVPGIRMRLVKYDAKFPGEKVHLLSDKKDYSAGETVWFSGYVTRASKPVSGNSILYTELFNDKGLIISTAMRPVTNGAVSGDLALPATLRAGTYYIRAYTAWMLNFSSSLFFYKKIMVTDRTKPLQSKPGFSKHDFSVRFFPEGGQLVNGLTSLVVFKAFDSTGNPVNVSGKVVSSRGDTVALLKTIEQGMGSFILHCLPQTTFTAIVTANGITKKIALPVIQSSGIVLHTITKTTAATDSIFFHISRSKESSTKYEHLLLCARMDNHFSVAKIHFDQTAVNDPLDTVLTAPYPLLLHNFPAGILQLTVLTEQGESLAERLIFLGSHQADSAFKHPAERNITDGETSIVINLPAAYKGSIAVAVTDADKTVDADESENKQGSLFADAAVLSGLLSPEWNATVNRNEMATDMQLIVAKPAGVGLQKQLLGEEPVVKYAAEKSMVLKGRAYEQNGGAKRPLKNGAVFMVLKAPKDSLSIPLTAFTDSTGFFTINNIAFHDTATIYVQTGVQQQGRTTNALAVEFDTAIADSIFKKRFVIAPPILNSRSYTSDTLISNPDEPAKTGVLKNVTVTARTKTHLDSVIAKYATGIFANPGSWAVTLDLTRDEIAKTTDQNILEYLNGKVAGLMYEYNRGMPIIYWRFSNMIDGLSAMDQLKLNAPSFFLNESLLNTGNDGYDGMVQLLSGIRVAEVAMIRVYKPGTMPNAPDNGPHGCVAIYLKNGMEEDKPPTKIAFQQTVKTGYTVTHNFDITQKSTANATLYWNPAVAADPVTHTVVVTLQQCTAQRLRVVAEGLDENGRLIQIDQVVQ